MMIFVHECYRTRATTADTFISPAPRPEPSSAIRRGRFGFRTARAGCRHPAAVVRFELIAWGQERQPYMTVANRTLGECRRSSLSHIPTPRGGCPRGRGAGQRSRNQGDVQLRPCGLGLRAGDSNDCAACTVRSCPATTSIPKMRSGAVSAKRIRRRRESRRPFCRRRFGICRTVASIRIGVGDTDLRDDQSWPQEANVHVSLEASKPFSGRPSGSVGDILGATWPCTGGARPLLCSGSKSRGGISRAGSEPTPASRLQGTSRPSSPAAASTAIAAGGPLSDTAITKVLGPGRAALSSTDTVRLCRAVGMSAPVAKILFLVTVACRNSRRMMSIPGRP